LEDDDSGDGIYHKDIPRPKKPRPPQWSKQHPLLCNGSLDIDQRVLPVLETIKMGSFDRGFVQQLRRESWGLYAAGVFIILLRLYVKYLPMLAGIQNIHTCHGAEQCPRT
jgi:hypothetical protein